MLGESDNGTLGGRIGHGVEMLGNEGESEHAGHVENDPRVGSRQPMPDTGPVELHHAPEVDVHHGIPSGIGAFGEGAVPKFSAADTGHMKQHVHTSEGVQSYTTKLKTRKGDIYITARSAIGAFMLIKVPESVLFFLFFVAAIRAS